MITVPEEHLLQHRAGRSHTTRTACSQPMQLQLRGNEVGCVLRVSSRAGPTAVDVRCNVVDLLAVFVSDDGVVCSACVGA